MTESIELMGSSETLESSGADGENRAAWAAGLAAFLVIPWILRTVHIFDDAGASDVRGYLSDGFFALLLWLILFRIRRNWRLLSIAALLWASLHIGIYEHLVALGALPSIGNAGYLFDPIFLAGSVLPVLLAPGTWVLFALAVGSVWWARRIGFERVANPLAGRRLPAFLAVLVLVAVAWPIGQKRSEWRQAHLFELAARQGLGNAVAFVRGKEPGAEHFVGQKVPEVSTAPDLAGELRLTRAPSRNVLLILLEGISAGYFPSVLESQDLGNLPGFMARTDRFFQSGLVYSNFISMQRQTNRGTYALLCGQPPRLAGGLPKMTDLVKYEGEEVIDCVPERIRRAGYHTVYLQGARLPFMFKDQFMPRAGYELVLGEQWFTQAYHRGEWGVDDRTFFEGALEVVREVRARDEPYFLTMLTVGTHHPYSVPDDYESPYPKGSFPWAVMYLDEILEPFFQELEAMGVMEDTLVVLSSDEAVGLAQARDDFTQMISQGWGYLGVLNPEGVSGLVSEPYMQTDLALSLLDYLGIVDGDGSEPLPFSGRSVFRQYSEPRTLAWGNVYLQRVAGIGFDGLLYGCKIGWKDCSKWQLEQGKIFSPKRVPVPLEAGDLAFLAAHINASEPTRPSAVGEGFGTRAEGAEPAHYGYHLIREQAVPLTSAEKQWIFGGQFFAVPAHATLEVELEVTLEGCEPESASVQLHHDLSVDSGNRLLYEKHLRLEAGQTARYRYAYRVGDKPVRRLECRLWVTDQEGRDLRLKLGKRTLKVVPSSGEAAEVASAEDASGGMTAEVVEVE